MLRFLLSLVLLLTLAQPQTVLGQSSDRFNSKAAREALESVEFQYSIANFRGADWLDDALDQINRQRADILRCVNARERELEEINQSLGVEFVEQLTGKEDKSTEEAAVSQQIAGLRGVLSDCKLLLDKSNRLLAQLSALETRIKRAQLNQRETTFLHNLRHGFTKLAAYNRNRLQGLLHLLGDTAIEHTRTLLIILLGGILGGWLLNRKARAPRLSPDQPLSYKIATEFGFLLRKRAPLLVPAFLMLGYLWITQKSGFLQSPYVWILLLLLGYTLSLILARSLVRRLRLHAQNLYGTSIPARGLYLRLVVIATLLAVWLQELAILGQDPEYAAAQGLMRNLLASGIVLSLLEFAFFFNRLPTLPRALNLVRIVSIILLAISLILELAGFRSMSRYIWGGLTLTAVSITGYYLFERIQRDFYDGLDSGSKSWQVRFRRFLSVAEGEPVPGLVWFRLISVALLWVILFIALIKAWGAPDSAVASLLSLVRDGFQIGDTLIVPSHVLFGILAIAILLMVFRWFRDSLDRKYLSKSRMDSGAREAMVTVTGYLGFIIACIAGLSIAGVSFDNLAIIAGALSLGIGFGLQNIVNNFVSGIILLFERPIRTGDWIVTGSTEGFVKRISVRSTEVQTFDRSDVIVPNSELISTQVTNWTLRDRHGRVIIPVGVAYGSDTGLVKKLLEEAADEVPEIIKNRPTLPVKVLFRSFGDSALQFELRCFIYDIWNILDVRSNLHFIIDRKFRENGVEIAFPQLDIHVRDGFDGTRRAPGE